MCGVGVLEYILLGLKKLFDKWVVA